MITLIDGGLSTELNDIGFDVGVSFNYLIIKKFQNNS